MLFAFVGISTVQAQSSFLYISNVFYPIHKGLESIDKFEHPEWYYSKPILADYCKEDSHLNPFLKGVAKDSWEDLPIVTVDAPIQIKIDEFKKED